MLLFKLQQKCTIFRVELTVESREVGGELYCLRCHDTMGIPICGACHRPIEERVVTALGKNWHVEVCFFLNAGFFFCLLLNYNALDKSFFSILYVPYVRSPSLVIDIMKERDSRIVISTTTK